MKADGRIILEFVGLRAKMYALHIIYEKGKMKAKGVKTCMLQKPITFDDYMNCLKKICKITRKQ